ncbi:MAG: hypothetical protein WCS87_18475 [Methylococcaceae bacterium]
MALAKAWSTKCELELQELEELITEYIAQFIAGYGRSKKVDIQL